jgi:multidrug efflux pump
MNLSAPFISRPIATTLLAMGLAVSGIIAFNLLPVSPLPQMDFPTINVQASLPGASPEIMATSVATPLERQLGRIAGVTDLTSSSSLGTTQIAIQFDLSRDIDGAARDVQAAINASLSQLPPELPGLPTYRKVNPADAPIMILSLTSDIYTPGQMYDTASTILQQKLSQVEGIGQVAVGGSSLPAVRVELNPTILNQYGIGLEEVRNAIAGSNANRPKGELLLGQHRTDITANDQIFKPNEYQSLIVTYRNNAPVRLSDVGEVVESVEDLRNAGLADGKPAVLLIIFKQPGANIIETVDRVRNIMPFLKATIPKAIDLTVVMDRTTTIRASLHDVEMTLLIATFLVILVVYIFLGNASAALIPSIAVPLSLLGTFAVMYLLKFSLDNLSLMALTIVTGFVVDDAVVVLENISRHIEAGLKPLKAALLGAKEVGFTVLSMSVSLIAVFIPILWMGGIVGRLFREFALTLSIAIMMSLLVSLTVTPMMSSRILKPKKEKNHKSLIHKIFMKVRKQYKYSLVWALRHDALMLLATIICIFFTILLFIYVPKGFFPQQDAGRIISSIQAEQDMSFQSIREKLVEFTRIIGEDPAIEHVVGFVGGNSARGGNAGNLYITLKPLAERRLTADQVITRLRSKLSPIPGATLYMQAAQDLVIGGRLGNAQYQYTLTADTLNELNAWAPKVLSSIAKLPGIADVNSDQRSLGLQVYVKIDHDMASRFGIAPRLIDDTLYDAFGQRQISIMYKNLNQYHVVMEVAPRYWQRPETLNDIYIQSAIGKMVPFSAIATFDRSRTSLAVNHQGQFPAATISFNLLPGYSLGEAVDRIDQAVNTMRLPANINGIFKGTAEAFQQSLSTQPYLILFALMAVYIVLGILYESLIHPITIISTLPSAGVGALLALILTGNDLNIIAIIGMILLIGLVKKNAIMMIDFALQAERNEGKTPIVAIFQAAVLRFRPILMTTFAALFGALPLALGTGVGSELRRPLGITIIGGLIASQMLTLYTTPVIYLAFERLSKWSKNRSLLGKFRPRTALQTEGGNVL